MITDLNVQHELLKTALLATDNYLGVEKKTVAAGRADASTLSEFISFYNIAYQSLMSLGVLDQHEGYMKTHLTTMWGYAKEEDTTLADDPYASTPGGAVGGADESVEIPRVNTITKSFANFIAEKKEEFSEDDINEMVDSLTWEDIVDLYPEEDLIKEDTEQLDEKLSAQARLKKRQSFARGKGKRTTAKSIKLRRASTPETLQKRAQMAARRSMYKKMLRGRDKSSLSASEKDRIEQQVSKMKNIQASIAVRMVPKMRSIEQKRLAHYRSGK
jgi:hypothetical protein